MWSSNAIAATVTEKTTNSYGIMDLVMEAGLFMQLILILLLIFSIISWAIIIFKYSHYKKSKKSINFFIGKFFECENLDDMFTVASSFPESPLASVFIAGYQEMQKLARKKADFNEELENIMRSMNKAHISEMSSIEEYVPFLATTASATPFIGLFGTVWGIMNSFRAIGATGSANIATVAPGISEALISTALGLLAAVPAVIFYNYFLSKGKRLNYEIKSFKSDLLNIIKRNF